MTALDQLARSFNSESPDFYFYDAVLTIQWKKEGKVYLVSLLEALPVHQGGAMAAGT